MSDSDLGLVSVVFGPGETLICLLGEIDVSVAEDLEQAAHDAICRGDPVIVDVSSVTFMDSTGLDAIAEIAAVEAEDGRRLVLAGASGRVRELLRVSGVADVVSLRP